MVASLVSARRAVADERIDDLKLAVSEACTNAIEAQARLGATDPVRIRVWEAPERLEVCIDDRGPGFDPERPAAAPPVTDPDRLNFERGLGIPLIRTLVDRGRVPNLAGGDLGRHDALRRTGRARAPRRSRGSTPAEHAPGTAPRPRLFGRAGLTFWPSENYCFERRNSWMRT